MGCPDHEQDPQQLAQLRRHYCCPSVYSPEEFRADLERAAKTLRHVPAGGILVHMVDGTRYTFDRVDDIYVESGHLVVEGPWRDGQHRYIERFPNKQVMRWESRHVEKI